jgi:DNA replication protein DnaC
MEEKRMTKKDNNLLTPKATEQLQYLGLRYLQENWDQTLNAAKNQNSTFYRFLSEIINNECQAKQERQIKSRIIRAKIEQILVMATFPFEKQPNLKKKFVLELYESLEFIKTPQDLLFIGPTGCGKTGLAISYLIHAINQGYQGYFIDYKDLLTALWRSIGEQNEKSTIKKFAAFDVLIIDELGHTPMKKEQAGLFFDLMKKRHQKTTTLITTQLGYDEWGDFLQDKHLTAAMIDRMTENCTFFNMSKCVSIRPKNVKFGTEE